MQNLLVLHRLRKSLVFCKKKLIKLVIIYWLVTRHVMLATLCGGSVV